MLGKCFNFSDIYDQMKLYKKGNNFRASVYASGILDLNQLHDASNRERNYAYVKKLPNRNDKVTSTEMEYAFYDNTNFYNIYYNEMKDVKMARRIIRSGKRRGGRSNHHNVVHSDLVHREGTLSGEEVLSDGAISVEKQSDRYLSGGGITDDLSCEEENDPFNPAKKSITFSSTHEAEFSEHAKIRRHNFSEGMSKWNSSQFYGNLSRKHNQEKEALVRHSNLFILRNKNKIIYKDKFNIFLNHNNNIFMPNSKDENDWLLSINSVYLFANSLSAKKSFNLSCHELLINLTIDNIKEMYKLNTNFNYNIYYTGFYINYLSFVRNIYVLPFLHNDKTCTEKSNEKLKINGVYLNSMKKLKVLDKNTLHNKLKVTKRMNSTDRSLYRVKYARKCTDSCDAYPPISLKSPCGKEDPYDTLPTGATPQRNDGMDGMGRMDGLDRMDGMDEMDRMDEMERHPSGDTSPNANNKFGILSKKRESVLIKDKSRCRNKCISFNDMNELIGETDEERNEKTSQKRDEQEGDVYNLIREKTLLVHDMEEDENYINNDITTMYTVRKYFLIKNFNIYKKMVHYYAKMQTFIDLEERNTKYNEIIHTLKETYVKIEQYRENLYYLYSQLFSIIGNINDEKNIICHGLVFLKLLNCLYSYSNKYVTNLFYYLFVFSKYNKFAYYLCNIQKYFDYKYFTYFTNKIGNVDVSHVGERMSKELTHSLSYNNSGVSPNEKYISMLPNSGSSPIMNGNFALQKEINENIKKEEMLKENEVTKKNLSCFIISALLYLYQPYMYRNKKCAPLTNRKKENLKKMFKRKQQLSSVSEEDDLLLRHNSAFYEMGQGDEGIHTDVGNQISREMTAELNDIYRMDNRMEENLLTNLDALNSKEGKETEIRKNKSYMFHKKGIKIKIKIRVNNVCLKIHQLNKENILTLNLYDLNYYMFTCLYQYHFFFHKTNEHVGFYLNDKVEKIKFEDIYAITEKNEMKKRVNSNLYMDRLWYELSAEESAIQDELYNSQWGKKKEKKNKNCIKMHLTFKLGLKTYDNMYNIQDNIINPITFNFLINEKFKYFPILHVHFYTTSINLNVTTSFLYLYKYLYSNLNFKKDINDVKNSNIEIYNDLHSEIIIFYKTRTKNNNYTWKLNIIDKNEYHQFPCECLYFCINKKKEKKKMNSELHEMNRSSEDFIITNEHDLNSIFRDICKIGFKKRNLHNSVAKHEKHLLYDNTQSVYDILHQFTYRMPFLYKNDEKDNKIINIIKKKPSWIYIGVLYTDDLYSRAYKVPNVKHNLLVEPEIIRNKWCLSIGTCIQIENNSGLYFRIYKEGKTKYFSRVNFKWKLKKNRKSSGNYSAWETLDGGTKNEKHKKKTKGILKNYHHQHDQQHDHHIHHHNNKHFTPHVEKNKKKERSKNGDYINILPFSKRAIPLFWLYDCSLPYIKILRKKEKKYNMKNFRKTNKEEEENLDIEAVPFHILYKLLNKYALNNNNIYQKKLDISPCEIVFKGLIMFHCFVKVKDVPTQHIKDTSYNYTVVIEPMVTIKNNLPNPITVIVRMKKKKRLFSITKKQENQVEEKVLHKTNYEINDDITKILKKQEMFALVPPHHYWCLPICTQAFYMKVFYHGLQLEKMNFIYDYANEIKGYYDFKDVKLPEWNEAFYGSNINSAMKKGDQGSSAGENSGVNAAGGAANHLTNQRINHRVNYRANHRSNDDRTGGNDDKNLHSNHNSSNGESACNIKEEHAKNVNYWQYRNRGVSNVTRDSRLLYDEMMKEFQNNDRSGETNSCNSPNPHRKKTIYDNLFRNNVNNMYSYDENEENNYQGRNNFKYNFLYATEGFFLIYMPTTDTITSTKVLNHKFGLIGNIFSYDELKYIYFENKISQVNKKVYDNLHIFKNITVSADVSRRKIDFYFPFFFENTTNVCIYVNNKLLPPNSRLYMTEEEAKNVRIKSYKHDYANNLILCSNVSGKIDCTRTNMIRPLINLIYRKINRKQKVRFWEKYEERKKKNSNIMNVHVLEEEEEHTPGDDTDVVKPTNSFKLKVMKDIDDGVKDKDDNLINDYDGEVDKQNTKDMKNTNNTSNSNDAHALGSEKSLTNETNREGKQNELGEHTPEKPSEKTDEITCSKNLNDTYYLPHDRNDSYYCNSKFSEISSDPNEDAKGKSTKKSPTHKSYKNALKNMLMSNKTLFKRRRKMSEKSSGYIGNFKKIRKFRLFHKHVKRDKINAEREDEEYFENMDERGEPFDNDGNEDSVDSSYYDGHDNDSKLKKKSKKRRKMRMTNFSYSRRGNGYKKLFSKNLYSLDKFGHKYFSKEKRKKDLSSQGGRDMHDSFSSENEKSTGAFPASQVSFSIFHLFKEKEETGKCSEFDEDISDDNANEQIEMEKEDVEEVEEVEEDDEAGVDEDEEDDAFRARSRRKTKHDILKFRLMKKRKKREKKGAHENELENERGNESEKNNSKIMKGEKRTYKKKRFKMTPFFRSVERKHKGKVPTGSVSHAKNAMLSSAKYNLDGSSSESGNYNKIASKGKSFERGQNGDASCTRVAFRKRNLLSRCNRNDVQVEAGDEGANEVNQEPDVKRRTSLRDLSRNKRENRKSKMKKKDYYEGGFLSLGICVRYAEEPFNKSKIVTFVNSYIFINRLPFDVKIATDSVRKSDSIFTTHNVALHSDFNNTYKEMLPLDALTVSKSVNNFKSLRNTPMEKDVCAINVSDASRGRENFKLDVNKDQVPDMEAFRIGDTKMERNMAIGGARNMSNINNNSFNEHGGHIESSSNLIVNRSSANYDNSEAPTVEVNQTEQIYGLNSKNENDAEVAKKNETYIRSGEITAFHYHRSYIKIKDSSEGYSSQPFSLIPKNVPSNFQIELFNMNKSQINNTNNLLVEVNVCSGIFGDKQQLPYTYNGYFYILSLPVRPKFEIINATKFIIAYATDVNKYTKKYMNNNYDTYLGRSTKNGDFPVKMIYPYSSIYYTLRNNNEIESSKIALKIVGVQKSSWCINSMNSFIDNVVMLPYRVYGESKLSSEKKFKGSRNSHKNEKDSYFLTSRRNSQKTHLQSDGGNVVLGEFQSNDSFAEVENDNRILNGDGEKEEDGKRRQKIEKDNIFLGHNLVNKKLYSFLIIRDNGSRAIVITEKYNLAREIVSTKNFSKIHRLITISSRKKILLSNKNANRKYMLDYKKMNFVYFNFPIVPVIYKMNIPRLTVTWIHRQDVIIAIHLSNLKYSGHIYPKEIINYDINQMFTPINILKRKEVEEYVQYVFLNSYVDSIFLIEQIHIDHFVKGDIPVILKNTNIEENEDIFLYIHVKQYCVDSLKQAPIYQSIMIKISPINANIELLVIEQLIEIIEKEKQLLLLYEREDKSLPPLIATSETARNAINTTLKIFSDANFLKMIYLDDYIRRKTENDFIMKNNQIVNNNIILNSANKNENKYKTIRNYERKHVKESEAEIKPNAYSYYFSSPKARMITQNRIININNITEKMCSEDSTNSSISTNESSKNKNSSSVHKKICKMLVGYYKYKKVHNLINNTYYDINNMNDERVLPIKIQYFRNQKIFMNAFSSHLFLHPNPRWMDNKSKPVYIREFKINPIEIIASIRTSEHRISRRILHIVDALPVDTPSMRIHLISQKRNYIVCTWDGLFQSLRVSYFRQLFRQSLPSAWLSNPFAFIKGFIKGIIALFKETVRGVKTSSNCFDGFMSGFKCGIIILVVNTVGGLFQSLSHMLNVCHKLMGGSRPRPPSILDSIILGFDGLLLDTFYRPWVSLFNEPKISLNKGNSTLKTVCIIIGCILRCIFAPIFGLLNLFASITEGFANTLIGDFERFSRVQERAEFETEKVHNAVAAMRRGKSFMKKTARHDKGA